MTRARSLLFAVCTVFIAAGFMLGGCIPNRVGVFGGTMFSGGLPALAVTPAPQLTPMAFGTLGGSVETDTTITAHARVNYAVFGDAAPTEPGKEALMVKTHGHTLVTELSNHYAWEFDVESNASHSEVYLRTIQLNGQEWTEHLLFADSEGDWFSELWQNNGRSVPERWIGKRWSRDYTNYYRVLMEYREPMPACIEVTNNAGQSYSVHAIFNTNTQECQRELKEFEIRAEQAFDIQNLRSVENPVEPGKALVSVLSRLPEKSPNMKKLVGTAQRRSYGGNMDWND
ncbi:MAG: DUF4851 domain-containing protein [Deltaproteobacteria bacterium]|jgi:hypothetical protein|nr:DUF4851 domain-containing protein [Deltaproteobacteria bacterium]